ncbi:uncharacterized protein LOC130139886 [Syzygium oleosum]|uniref:uncharacterized protein LOC115665245 n=1 Tax=Syzygium oleosum TaxID=219896 RepID=UPI0024B9FC14|nr:uncharacterized protein LOC115665245 [Syzygium oleosum]XP_056173807.1 uncharacterized protein LOC115665245 [Syzygium oleosum]XP_056173808.1 uncharacterized protein LOC115665245 [Syzygium oleosum]XP_056173810.1 uncharacterized protein LOC130139886 [Syzygium oleosum]
MDEAPAKWNVTFTKHLKQKKRKSCRHGFLSLHSSTAKVMLYDDGEQLLECRILKNDEVVCSGETMTFNAYLVDVGEPEGGPKPLDDAYTCSREKKVPKGRASLHRNTFVKVSDSAGDVKTKVEKGKQQTIDLSPSQKIIKEFKKNEMNKYGILQASPNSRTSSTTGEFGLLLTHLCPYQAVSFS